MRNEKKQKLKTRLENKAKDVGKVKEIQEIRKENPVLETKENTTKQ